MPSAPDAVSTTRMPHYTISLVADPSQRMTSPRLQVQGASFIAPKIAYAAVYVHRLNALHDLEVARHLLADSKLRGFIPISPEMIHVRELTYEEYVEWSMGWSDV